LIGEMRKVGHWFGLTTHTLRRAVDDVAQRSGTDWGQRLLGRDRGRRKPGWAGAGPKGCGDLGRHWNFQRKSGWATMAIGPN
jgi:hypothetical protein